METLLSLSLGLGLAAACGFRVFVPLLALSLASSTGHVALSGSFEWIGETPALIAFGAATVLEIAAYYVPWVDNLLDGVASPAAVVAGVLVTASVVTDVDPLLRWTLAVIAGGGVAGIVQGLTTGTRGASVLSTAGLGNPVVSTLELGGSVIMTLLAIFLPVGVVLVLVGALLWVMTRRRRRQPA